ncbi:ion transporter [Halodesulfovibrio aestuarii]|uniref:Ion transporter n=1 Tax=Halodesulfovibrio aestuarii TaxID=126333 RepID=A0ABV4JTV8_9BACT
MNPIDLLIIFNGVTTVVDAFPQVRELTHGTFAYFDAVCCAIFIAELARRIQEAGWYSFAQSTWNKFDLLVVAASSPVVLSPWINTDAFGVVLLLRFARLARLFKLLAIFPNREHMARAICRAVRAGLGVLGALIFALVLFSLAACSFYGQAVPSLFGNPAVSLVSIFQIFTIEGWFEVQNIVLAACPDSALWQTGVYAFFATVVLLGGVVGLGLFQAVLTDEMVADNNEDLERRLEDIDFKLNTLIKESRRVNR